MPGAGIGQSWCVLIGRVAVLSALLALFSSVTAGTAWLLLPDPAATSQTSSGTAPQPSPGVGTAAGVRARAVERPSTVLATWDERRARAWEAGDVEALRTLYVDGSRTGRRDARMLEQWNVRGVRVGAMSTEVDRVVVRRRDTDRLVLKVTDRLVADTADLDEGAQVRLPDDGWSTRVVELRKGADGWRVAEVRESPGS